MADYSAQIKANLTNCLTETDLNIGDKYVGKTRDVYTAGERLVLITTDRHTSFDRRIADIPFKGQAVNQTSAWWFEQTTQIAPNHVLAIPDPNVTIGRKLERLPIEFVVRSYMTGSTGTSIWVHYQKGSREFCGHRLPDGLQKNQALPEPILTPSTKTEKLDKSVPPEYFFERDLIRREDWEAASEVALNLFRFGQETAKQRGLILVDTKYELAKDADGRIVVIDEIHTQDSSRFWLADTYEERISTDQEPDNFDKEFMRLWFAEHTDPYNDKELPPAPENLVVELSNRYIRLYEMITGQTFQFPESDVPIEERVKSNLSELVS